MPAPLTIITNSGHELHAATAHPERPARVTSLVKAIESDLQLRSRFVESTRAATDEELLLVHTRQHLLRIGAASAGGREGWFDADTYHTGASDSAARQAVGATLTAVDAVCLGEFSSAFAAVRPPGHHATAETAQGFCIYNNVAVAAVYAQRRHGVGRVAVVDIDVHHGNGTEAILGGDDSVLYISMHQVPLYPGTGLASAGNIINIPLSPGADNRQWLHEFTQRVLPPLQEFAPELILVSCGLDAHHQDPLAGLNLDESAYAEVARQLRTLAAARACRGIVWVLEGGYSEEALAQSALAIMHELVQ